MIRLVVIFCLLSFPAFSGSKVHRYYNDQYSVNDLGTINPKLSILCSLDRFNQKSRHRLTVYFKKENITLQGSNAHNIRDLDNIADPTKSYWFQYDGHSNCVVREVPR